MTRSALFAERLRQERHAINGYDESCAETVISTAGMKAVTVKLPVRNEIKGFKSDALSTCSMIAVAVNLSAS
jgi:hypothetical protein